MPYVAIITGGASGMGLAVARSLAKKDWHVHIADINADAASTAAADVSGSYSVTNFTDYRSLHDMFKQVFEEHGHINFVFANAGVGERTGFYKQVSDAYLDLSPRELDRVLGIDLHSIINTSYLARHFMARNKTKGMTNLVLNESIAGIYPVRFCPIYTAAKHGVVGFARAISTQFYGEYGIRVNTLCPGNVRTNLFKSEEWDTFTQQEWIDVSQIVGIVEKMLFGGFSQGAIVEVAPKNHYVVETPPYKDDNVRLSLELSGVTSLGKWDCEFSLHVGWDAAESTL